MNNQVHTFPYYAVIQIGDNCTKFWSIHGNVLYGTKWNGVPDRVACEQS